MKFKCLAGVLIMLFTASLSQGKSVDYLKKSNNLNQHLEDFEEINLQDKVFRHYYGELDDEIKNELSLEDFENAYQNSEYQITEFVEKLNKKDLHISGPSIRKAATLSQYWYQE